MVYGLDNCGCHRDLRLYKNTNFIFLEKVQIFPPMQFFVLIYFQFKYLIKSAGRSEDDFGLWLVYCFDFCY